MSRALGGYAVLLLLLMGTRAALHYRRTGRNPIPALATFRPGVELLSLCGLVVWLALVARYAVEGPFGPFVLQGIAYRRAYVPGLLALGAGAALLAVAINHLGSAWRIGMDRDGTDRLVTTGMYGVIRHPIYTGMQLGSLGAFLLAPNVAFLVAVPLMIAGTRRQALAEETFLRERFPDAYPAYMARTGRFLPRLSRQSD